MNSDVLKGKWNQMIGGLKQKWGDLTDNDWTHINGDKDKLVGKIQERYGYAKDRAAREVDQYFHDEWVRSLFGYAVEELKRECDRRGKETSFRMFERYELENHTEATLTYQRLSEEFHVSVTQVTNLLAFARREFQRIVLDRLREITASDGEFREEVRSLFGVSE